MSELFMKKVLKTISCRTIYRKKLPSRGSIQIPRGVTVRVVGCVYYRHVRLMPPISEHELKFAKVATPHSRAPEFRFFR